MEYGLNARAKPSSRWHVEHVEHLVGSTCNNPRTGSHIAWVVASLGFACFAGFAGAALPPLNRTSRFRITDTIKLGHIERVNDFLPDFVGFGWRALTETLRNVHFSRHGIVTEPGQPVGCG